MIASGDTTTDSLRAEQSGAMAAELRSVVKVPGLRDGVSEPLSALPARFKAAPQLQKVSGDILVIVSAGLNRASGSEKRLPGKTGMNADQLRSESRPWGSGSASGGGW